MCIILPILLEYFYSLHLLKMHYMASFLQNVFFKRYSFSFSTFLVSKKQNNADLRKRRTIFSWEIRFCTAIFSHGVLQKTRVYLVRDHEFTGSTIARGYANLCACSAWSSQNFFVKWTNFDKNIFSFRKIYFREAVRILSRMILVLMAGSMLQCVVSF